MYIYNPDEIFAYLDKCARKKGYTSASALCEAADVEPSTYSRLKNGRAKNPGILPLVSLFRAADASLDTAFTLNSDETANGKLKHQNELLSQKLAAKERLLTDREKQIRSLRDGAKQRGKLIIAQAVSLIILLATLIGVIKHDRLYHRAERQAKIPVEVF